MLIKDSIDIDIFDFYKEDEEEMWEKRIFDPYKEDEDEEYLMWELEELNQGYKQGTQSWDL